MSLRAIAVTAGAFLCLSSFASAQSQDVKFHSVGDGSLYAKTFSNLVGTWSEEVGVAAPLATWNRWTFKWNAGYILNYPLKFSGVRPNFLVGGALAYRLWDANVRPELYTKTKWYNSGKKVQESGLSGSMRWGHYGLVANAAYIMGYQKDWVVKPQWQVGLALNYYFK